MIPVTSNGIKYWINFEHTKLQGADVRDIPRYEELERMLADISSWQRDTLRMIVSDNPEHNAAAVEMGTLALDRMPANIDALLKRIEHGLSRVSHRTVCRISYQTSPTTSTVLVSGESLTMKGDPFNRRTGRWWSLTRAMEAFEDKGLGHGGDLLAAYMDRGNAHSATKNYHNDEVTDYVAWYETEYLAKHPRVFSYYIDGSAWCVGAAA